MLPLVAVFIEGYQYNTSGKSLYEAVSNAMTVMESDWWKGPKWTRETVFDVKVVNTDARYSVRAADVIAWRPL